MFHERRFKLHRGPRDALRFTFCLLLGFHLACTKVKPQDPVAWVGDQPITVAEFQQALHRELASFPELSQEDKAEFQQTKQRVLENLIELKLLVRGTQDAHINLEGLPSGNYKIQLQLAGGPTGWLNFIKSTR